MNQERIVVSTRISADLNTFLENAVEQGFGHSKADIVFRAVNDWANRIKVANMDFTDPVCPSCLAMLPKIVVKRAIKVVSELEPRRDDLQIRPLCCPYCSAIISFGEITDAKMRRDGAKG